MKLLFGNPIALKMMLNVGKGNSKPKSNVNKATQNAGNTLFPIHLAH